jgi:hypothetical protein
MYPSLNSEVKAMVDGYWKRCFETLCVVDEEDVNPLRVGWLLAVAWLASGSAAAMGAYFKATPP